MAQLAKRLPYKYKDPSWVALCNPSTGEAKKRGSLGLAGQNAHTVSQLQAQGETLSQLKVDGS